jgi:hypothetical protein
MDVCMDGWMDVVYFEGEQYNTKRVRRVILIEGEDPITVLVLVPLGLSFVLLPL